MSIHNIYTSISPFYRVFNLTGVLIFTISTKPSLSISKWNWFSIFLVISFNALMSCSYWNMDLLNSFAIIVAKNSEPILIFLDHLVCLFTIFWTFRHRHGILKILNILNEIDEIFLENGIETDHIGFRSRMAKLLTGIILYTSTLSAFSAYNMDLHSTGSGILLASFAFWVYWLSAGFQFHFICIVTAISMRFTNVLIWIQKYPLNLVKISKIHLRLIEVVKICNGIFSQLLMLYIGSLFSWNCFGAFAFTVMRKSTTYDYYLGYTLLLNLGFPTLLMIVMIKKCEKMLEVKENTVEALFRVRVNAIGSGCDVGNEIEHFVSQILNTNPQIRCWFFDFSWRFLFQVRIFFGRITTKSISPFNLTLEKKETKKAIKPKNIFYLYSKFFLINFFINHDNFIDILINLFFDTYRNLSRVLKII